MPYPETIAYIKRQIEKGIDIDKIKKALIESGYQQDVIDELLSKAGAPKPEKKSSGIEVLLKDAAIGVFLLIMIGSLVYFNFFNNTGSEKFSPNEQVQIDISNADTLNLEKDGFINVNLNQYAGNSNPLFTFEGTLCVNVQISGNNAILRSVFLPNCPLVENIMFTAVNPDGQTDSFNLKIKIV
jgi:hypothetical protein